MLIANRASPPVAGAGRRCGERRGAGNWPRAVRNERDQGAAATHEEVVSRGRVLAGHMEAANEKQAVLLDPAAALAVSAAMRGKIKWGRRSMP